MVGNCLSGTILFFLHLKNTPCKIPFGSHLQKGSISLTKSGINMPKIDIDIDHSLGRQTHVSISELEFIYS